jgi:hypothetical protein
VYGFHPAESLITEYMISMATTLQTNDHEEADNPNTDKCKAIPTCHRAMEYWENYRTLLMSQSILLKARGLCKYTIKSLKNYYTNSSEQKST